MHKVLLKKYQGSYFCTSHKYSFSLVCFLKIQNSSKRLNKCLDWCIFFLTEQVFSLHVYLHFLKIFAANFKLIVNEIVKIVGKIHGILVWKMNEMFFGCCRPVNANLFLLMKSIAVPIYRRLNCQTISLKLGIFKLLFFYVAFGFS